MKFLITLLIGLILQLVAQEYLTYKGIGINILFLITVELSLLKGSNKGQIFGFAGGIIEDIFTFGLLGERAFIRTIIGYLGGKIKGMISVEKFMFQLSFIFILFVFHEYFITILRIVFSFPLNTQKYIFINAVLNGLLGIPVYKILEKTDAG